MTYEEALSCWETSPEVWEEVETSPLEVEEKR